MRVTSKPPRFQKFDKRLLGTWKSDKRRTFKDWVWKKKLAPARRKFFESLFGKLRVTYTRGRVISSLRHRGWEQSQRYIVVAHDETSVAIVKYGPLQIKDRRKYDAENLKLAEEMFGVHPKITHIHFDKQHYWISLGNGRNREFFRKISS
jgi:hypothetical protein